MRIPDYRNVHGVKDVNHWTTKTNRVNKTHEDEFEKELADCLNKRESEPKTKRKKDAQKEYQGLVDESQELDEILLENNHLLSESETDMNVDKETPNNSDHFSSWA